MSMGTSAAFDYVVKDEVVAKVVGKKIINKFNATLKKAESKPDFVHLEGPYDPDSGDTDQELVDAANTVASEFKKNTGIGIDLCYHSPDCGDRYDEVSEWYWSTSENDLYVTVDTENFKKLKALAGQDAIERQFYTVFG